MTIELYKGSKLLSGNTYPFEDEEIFRGDPQDREQVLAYNISSLNDFTDRYFYAEASARGGYKNMGEILYDAEAGDQDAQFLKALYDAVWAKEEALEAELEGMTLEELHALDLEAWAREAFDAVKAELEASSGGSA